MPYLKREVITITEQGHVTIGNNIFNFDPHEFGSPHINNLGVSVLPARMILSILLDENPNDNTIFVWDYESTTFEVDPNGYEILFELENPTMFVRGIPRQIFSGVGSSAFLTSPYIDLFQNNRLFVPTRTIAEVLGFNVEWDEVNSIVTLIPIN